MPQAKKLHSQKSEQISSKNHAEQFIESGSNTYSQILFYLLAALLFIAPLLAPTSLSHIDYKGAVYSAPAAPDFYKAWWLFCGELLLVAVLFFFLHRQKQEFKLDIVTWSWIGFLGWCSITLLWASHLNLAMISIFRWWQAGLLLPLLQNILKTPKDIEKLLWWKLAAGLVVAVIGILQYFDLASFMLTSGKKLEITQAVGPASTFGNRNMAWDYLIFLVPLTWFFFIKEQKLLKSLLPLGILAVFVAYAYFAQNKATYVSIGMQFGLIGLIHLVYFFRKDSPFPLAIQHKAVLGASLGLILLVILLNIFGLMDIGTRFFNSSLFNPDYYSFTNDRFTTFTARIMSIYNSLMMIWDNFFLGVGFGNWTVHYTFYSGNNLIPLDNYVSTNTTILYKQAHNEFLQLLAETGIIGGILALVVALLFFSMAWQLIKAKKHLYFAYPMVFGLIGSFPNMAASFPLRISMAMTLIVLFMGCLAVLLRYEGMKISRFEDKFKLNRPVNLPSMLAILALCAAMAYQINNTYARWVEGHKFRNVGAGLTLSKNVDKAIVTLKKSLELVPEDPDDALYIIGNLYLHKKQFALAEKYYLRGLSSVLPYHPYMVNQLGLLYIQTKQYQKALAHYEKYAKLMPKQDAYWIFYGNMLAIFSRNDEAVVAYEKALEVNPQTSYRDKLKQVLNAHYQRHKIDKHIE